MAGDRSLALTCRSIFLGALAAMIALPAAAASLTDAEIRRFLTRQEDAWNARRFDAYFAGFTADAVFVDQARTPKEIIPYGRSSLAQARALARKAARSTERGTVRRIEVAPDGRSARVLGYEVTTIDQAGKPRRVCAETEQRLVLQGGRILSKGQTDSIVRCRGG